MTRRMRPFRTTVIFGGICGLLYIPVDLVFGPVFFWPMLFRTTVFCCIAGYAVLLARWGNRRLLSILFPLLFLSVMLFSKGPISAFLLTALGLLSWIRSGICFGPPRPSAFFAEGFLSLGGGALVAYLDPRTAVTWALGIWLFFLIQSLYFMIIDTAFENRPEEPPDAFEQARMRAEGILKP